MPERALGLLPLKCVLGIKSLDIAAVEALAPSRTAETVLAVLIGSLQMRLILGIYVHASEIVTETQRPPLQSRPDWGHGCREVVPASTLCGRHLHGKLHCDDRCGLPFSNSGSRWSEREAANRDSYVVGHCGAGALPHYHKRLLPRR